MNVQTENDIKLQSNFSLPLPHRGIEIHTNYTTGQVVFSICTCSVNLLNKQDLLIKRTSEGRAPRCRRPQRCCRDATRARLCSIFQNDLKLKYERKYAPGNEDAPLANFTVAKKKERKEKTKSKIAHGKWRGRFRVAEANGGS